MTELPVSVYFVWQWWERHYQHALGRPRTIDLDWLDATCLGRQRFLADTFKASGISTAESLVTPAFLSRVMPYHTMIIPVLLGMNPTLKEIGGYAWNCFPEEQLKKLKAVDIANTWLAERIAQERSRKLKRYGVVTRMIDLGSVTNNAFMLRGPEFYADLMIDQGLARHYLEVLCETACLAHRFLTDLFGPIKDFPLSNCNVSMMSPELYMEMVREYDIRCVEYAANLAGKPPSCNLHHCNVKADHFAEAYRAIPGLRSLQASYLSDIPRINNVLPGVSFSAMVNPVDILTKPAKEFDEALANCLSAAPADLAIWDIDPDCSPSSIRILFEKITSLAMRHDRNAVFSIIPVSWEELDWEFPCYYEAATVFPEHPADLS